MSPSVEDAARFLERNWLKDLLFVLATLVLLAGSIYVYAFVRIVPPISATVVDAVTEKPIPGISVCLEATLKQVNGPVVRTEVRKTDAKGRVFFWPSIHALSLLQEWNGYSIRVTDPQTDFAVPCGANLRPRLNLGQPGMGDRGEPSWSGYFPVAMLQTDKAPETGPTAESTRRLIHWPLGMYIPLIPVMTSMEMCAQVRDAGLVKSCQKLNADVAARRFRDPSPNRIGRLMRVTNSATDNDWERGGPHRFLAVYSSSVTASISPTFLLTEVYADPESAKRTYQSRTTAVPGNLPESAAEVDMVAGQKIRRIHGAQDEAFWISKNRLVLVTFVESSGMDDAFLAECLTYFPSDL